MILFWFLIGIALILCISRYNESDKLFWTLFISFIGTFAATVAVSKYISNKKQDKIEYVTSAPTQALYTGSHCYCVMPEPSVSATIEPSSSEPVSKDIQSNNLDLSLSKIAEGIRGQPVEYFDDS